MPAINLQINYSKKELRDPGWAWTLIGRNISPAFLNPVSLKYERDEGSWSRSKLWQEPLTGAIMLRPQVAYADFWTKATHESTRLNANEFDYAANDWAGTSLALYSGTPGQEHLYTTHSTTGGALDNLVTLALVSILGSIGGPPGAILGDAAAADMGWLLVSKNALAPNEGIFLSFKPLGLFPERHEDYFVAIFGDEFALVVGTNGKAALWQNLTGTSTGWKRLKVMHYGDDTVGQHHKQWSITILPFARKYLGIYFGSSSPAGLFGHESQYDVGSKRNYMVRVRDEALYDPTHDIDRITKAGKLVMGGLKKGQYAMGFAVVRYPDGEQTMNIAPNHIGAKKVNFEPEFQPRFVKNNGAVTVTAKDHDGTAWAKADDVWLMPQLKMTAGKGSGAFSDQNLYTPELYALTTTIAPYILTETRTPVDLSAFWQSISLRMRTEDDGSDMDVQTIAAESLYQYTTKPSWPIFCDITDSITGKIYRVFEGWVEQPQSTLGRPGPILSLPCRDGWLLLEENFIDSPIWDGDKIYKAVKWMLNMLGYDDTQIVVDDDVMGLELALPRRVGEFNFTPEPGDQIKETLQNLLTNFSDVRLRQTYADPSWVPLGGGVLTEQNYVWHLMRDPDYDWLSYGGGAASVPITAQFYVDVPVNTPLGADNIRWAANPLLLHAQAFERDMYPPEFNILQLDAPSSAGADATKERTVAITNAASVTDPTSRDYIGRYKQAYLPPEVTNIKSGGEAAILARELRRTAMKSLELASWRGEWRPKMRPYQFVEIFGRDYASPPNLVKYGVYRLEEVQADINGENQGADWWATYVGRWVGAGTAFTPVSIGTKVGAPVGGP